MAQRTEFPEAVLEKLRKQFSYNSETGVVVRTTRKGPSIGTYLNGGYRTWQVKCCDKTYVVQAHQIAWFLSYGEWPPYGMEIDHIDRDPTNNRIANLRIVTVSENHINRKDQLHSSRFRNVCWNKVTQKWEAKVKRNYKTIHLGLFVEEEEANKAVLAWKAEHDRPIMTDLPDDILLEMVKMNVELFKRKLGESVTDE